MGVYLTIAELVPARLPERDAVQLTVDDDGETADEAVLATFIDASEAEVEGYLGAYYDLAAVRAARPALVTDLVATVAVYKLRTRRPGAVAEEHKAPYEAAIARLKAIAKGEISLGVERATTPDAGRRLRVGGSGRQFSRAKLGGAW
ncbi:DUF1320 domain-containing protein [Myxococcota bacterium]|nr:DUF1320 domain-containing protein [Myxococcota bacterium]